MKITNALLVLILSSFSSAVIAQNITSNTQNSVSIQSLVEARIDFNKTLIKSREISKAKLPKPQYIFNQLTLCNVSFEGLNFSMENRRIVAINEIPLSRSALNIINERLMVLDKMQYAYSEGSNHEYLAGQKNSHVAFNNDRQFFAVLKSLKATLEEIGKMTKEDNNSLVMERNLANWKQPNIDWAFFSQIVVKDSQSQLGK